MRAPVLALLTVLLASPLTPVALAPVAWAADAATPDAIVAAQAASLRVKSKGNANVRFGPSREAKVAVVLKDGEEVEVLAESRVKDWYAIRFPKKGQAWVHQKVLESVDGGRRWKVTVDQARARDDSTLKSEIVAELRTGEILEDRGDKRGDWVAVHLPNAIAYMHKSVLAMPEDIDGERKQSASRATQAVAVWNAAQKGYEEFRSTVHGNAEAANYLDWDALGLQLDQVIRDHADVQVRIAAQRLKDGITNVSSAAAAYQKAKGISPVKKPYEWKVLADQQVEASAPVATTTAGATPTGTAPVAHTTPPVQQPGTYEARPVATRPDPLAKDPLEPDRLQVPSGNPPGSEPAKDPSAPAMLEVPPNAAQQIPSTPLPEVPTPAPKPLAKSWSAEGILSQQETKVPGANYVLLDGDSNVIAFLIAKPGVDIPFSEFYWRDVGVTGAAAPTDAATNGVGRAVPVIQVEELGLSGK